MPNKPMVRAAMLAIIPAGESPVGGISPVATVVIPGDGKGDQLVESPEVKVSVREASNSTGRSEGEWLAPKACLSEVPNPCTMGEGQRRRRRNWAQVVDELPGVVEGDMSRRNGLRKHGTTRGSPRRSRTAKASCILPIRHNFSFRFISSRLRIARVAA